MGGWAGGGWNWEEEAGGEEREGEGTEGRRGRRRKCCEMERLGGDGERGSGMVGSCTS